NAEPKGGGDDQSADRSQQQFPPWTGLRLFRRVGCARRPLRSRRRIGVTSRSPLVAKLPRLTALLAHGGVLSSNGWSTPGALRTLRPGTPGPRFGGRYSRATGLASKTETRNLGPKRWPKDACFDGARDVCISQSAVGACAWLVSRGMRAGGGPLPECRPDRLDRQLRSAIVGLRGQSVLT